MAEDLTDLFKGDDAALVESIKAALALNRDGALAPRIPTMATTLLEAAAVRLAVSAERPGREDLVVALQGLMDLWRRQAAMDEDKRAKFERGSTAWRECELHAALLYRVASDLKLTISSALHAHPAPVKADTAGEGWVLAPRDPAMVMLNAAVDATGAGSGMSWNGLSPQRLFEIGYRAMLSAVPATPEGPKEQGSSRSQPVLSPESDTAGATSPGEPAPPARWQTMDRFGLIDTARNWADRQMVTHDTRTDLAQSVRDAAFYRADALYEFAAHIEDGNFDAARPCDGGEAVHSQPRDQAPSEPSSSTDKTNAG